MAGGALVTGGASGLGAAVARALHARGASVVVADRDARRGNALVAELGERAEYAEVDVTSPTDVERAVEIAAGAPGGLRMSVQCAGVFLGSRLVGRDGPHDPAAFDRVVSVNLGGTFNALRAAAAAMAVNTPDPDTSERGVCVNTASVAAFDGQVGQIAYSASKAGIAGMTLPAARDLAQLGIRVCAVAPGPFDTPFIGAATAEAREHLVEHAQFPRRLGEAEEFAALVCHLVENPMLNGETIRLDGAMRMPPR